MKVDKFAVGDELYPTLCKVLGVPEIQGLRSFTVSIQPGKAAMVTLEIYARLDSDLVEIIKAHTLLNGGGQ